MNGCRTRSLCTCPGSLLIVCALATIAVSADGTTDRRTGSVEKLFGMRGYPGGSRSGRLPIEHSKFFPMIDSFGQYVHKDWPGKTKSIEDFAEHKRAEGVDLARRPGPKNWNQYGGWKTGPQLEGTGRFRVTKHRGKWWLVDPDGRLFWSHGTDCVRSTTGTTPITDRKHFFAEMPEKDSPLGRFYGKSWWAPHGYYKGRHFETYNFSGANLLRKYGADWKRQFAERSHRRLRSWGMNTIANWSDPEIYLTRKTPYVVTISAHAKPIQGSRGFWGKFPDVFDPDFRKALRKLMARQKGKSAGDRWCVGYFVGNELSWGKETSLAVAALASPPEQAAKRVFVDDLKKKYETIERLNRAWKTGHACWDDLLQCTTPPKVDNARSVYGDDLTAFYTKTVEQYFRTCREAVKEVDPEGLYLGCRFSEVNDRAARMAAKYCDVVSYNRYKRSVADFRLPDGIDKPVIIGEFHFGALDRGMFHTGLVKVANQQARAAAYKSYVRGALENPLIVGTHWFQYGDQATTGRGDGENYQIGLLDVCDTPYTETIEACREVGYGMYPYREGKQ